MTDDDTDHEADAAAEGEDHDHDHDHEGESEDHDHEGESEDHDHEGESEDHDHDHEGESGDAETEAEGLQHGDFVRLSYTAYTVESDQLVDTTDESVAEEEGVDTEGQSFGPRTVVLGEGSLFGPVEDDVVGREVGDSATVTVPAAEAFGEHEADEVRTVSVDKLPEDDRYPGASVQIDGEQGFVEAVIGGRARVDFNHPLAGEDVEYEYEILEQVEDRVEQAKGLFSMYVDVDLEMWIQTDEVEEEVTVTPDEDEDADAEGEGEETEAEDEDDEPEPRTETEVVEKETLYIEATPQLTMNQQWMFSKQQVARQVMEKLDLDRVIVQETIEFTGGMGGMMGGMGGMMGGMGGEGEADVEEIVEELE